MYGLSPAEKLALARLVEAPETEFDNLPENYRRLILEAEALRQRHKDATAAETPRAVDAAWNDVVERLSTDTSPAAARPNS